MQDLDQISVQVVETVCQRFLAYPDESNKEKMSKNRPVVGGLLPVESQATVKAINSKLQEVSKQYDLPKDSIEASVFYFYHGLSLLPPSLIEYVKGEDFVDVGAYVGDSAIALSSYDYRKIYSIEMSQHSINAYHRNMEKAGIPREKYEVINVAISTEDDLPAIELPDTGSAGFSLMRKRGKYDVIEIEQRSFDTLVKEHGIKPRFIKVDIEGYAMHFVQGGIQALKKYRPVLSLAIYHNPTEFFEIKPFLEAELPNYGFMIRKLTPGIQNNLCHSEVILLAYPLEIGNA
ncbi:FkbM family methyltransferase [Lewinella sp. LCG006]|uniref:FkbM family methyltransferase n=1 Tax=Lewinella sp. LCG006 TaxID=3231911 RepID=UPI00345FC5C5